MTFFVWQIEQRLTRLETSGGSPRRKLKKFESEIAGIFQGSLHETHFDRRKSKLTQKSMGDFREISMNNLTPALGRFRHSSPCFVRELTQLRCPCHAHSQGQESSTLQWMLIACWKEKPVYHSNMQESSKEALYMKMMEL